MADEEKKMGRPLLFNTPDELEQAVDSYFTSNARPTLSGLAVHLGIDRTTLYNYGNRDEFFHILKKAQARVETIYEERLVWDNCVSVIFPLKNMGWKDRTETDMNVTGSVPIQLIMPPDEIPTSQPDPDGQENA